MAIWPVSQARKQRHYPPLNSKALSLISKARNKAFRPRPSHDNDPDCEDASLDRHLLSSPHPAMGLTMGIMEASEGEDEAEVGRSRLSYSPAMGVKGYTTPCSHSLLCMHRHSYLCLRRFLLLRS